MAHTLPIIQNTAPAAAVQHPHLHRLLAHASNCGPIPVAIAYPCDASSLESAVQASRAGLIAPLLVGPRKRMLQVAEAAHLNLQGMAVYETGDDPREAAVRAAALCREGEAAALMKGSLRSDELLAAAMSREAGLRGERRVSHVFVLDVPGFDRPLLITDCVVNITPSLMDKRDIAQNAIDLAQALGIACVRVAVLSAVGEKKQ